jgi:hypothetical protein
MLFNVNGRLAFEAERSLAFGSISGTYAKVGGALAHPIRILVLQNQTDVAVTFSFDGTNDTITLQSKIAFTFDLTANKTSQNSLLLGQGTQIWVKGSPGSGSVYMSAFYATGN